jgi:hypothetical protein
MRAPSLSILFPAFVLLLAALMRPDGDLARDPADSRGKWADTSRPIWKYQYGKTVAARSEVIYHGGRVYTLLELSNAAEYDAHGREYPDDGYAFERLIPESTAWVFGQYERQLTEDREEGYLAPLEEFDRRLGNRVERLLLFEGKSFDKLIGTLEFTHRSPENPLLPLEQAKGIRLKAEEIRQERVSRYAYQKKRRGTGLPPLVEHLEETGATLEVNKLVSHPDYRGIAAPLLWTAAITRGVFDHPVLRKLNHKQRVRSGIRSGEMAWEYGIPVLPSRMQIRPNRRMIPYFEALGFAVDPESYPSLRESEQTDASRYARGSGMQVDDVLMWISREEWLKIPQRLLKNPKQREGAETYLYSNIKRQPREWAWHQASQMGLSAAHKREVQAGLELGIDYDQASVRRRWQRWAREYQERLSPEKRHWAFQREPLRRSK